MKEKTIIHLYDENGNKVKSLHSPKDWNEGKNFEKYFPDYKGQKLYITEENIINAMIGDGKVKEMTREDLIIYKGQNELLAAGEIIEDGKIILVEAPERLYKKNWNVETAEWEESITRDELIELRKSKIIEYEKLKKEKETLENSEFATVNEKEVITEEMEKLKKEINKILEDI